MFVHTYMPIPMAERPKARVYGRSVAGFAGSNSTGGMDVRVVCYRKRQKAKWRAIKTKNEVRIKYRVQRNPKKKKSGRSVHVRLL